jgi:two-component system chemotaxis sensor kinase CheA
MGQGAVSPSVIQVRPNLLYRAGFGVGAVIVLAALGVFWYGGSRILLGVLPSYASLAGGAVGILIAMGCSFANARLTRRRASAALDVSSDAIVGLEARVHELEDQARQLTRHNNALEERGDELEQMGRELAAASEKMSVTLAAVRPYFAFIDANYTIDGRYCNVLERVLQQEVLGGQNFLEVLKRSLSEPVYEVARDYLKLLFDPAQDEGTLLDANPLDGIAIGVRNNHGLTSRRYVTFRFSRIVKDDVVTRLIVSLVDVTERTLREQRLRHAERKKATHFDMLMGMLHVSQSELDRFVALAKEQYAYIDDALDTLDISSAKPPPPEAVRQSLGGLLQRARAVTANASVLHLERFEAKAKALESRIAESRQRGILGGSDIVAIASAISNFWTELEELQLLRGQLEEIARAVRGSDDESDDLVSSIGELATTLARHLGKMVRIDATGFDSRGLPPDRRLVVKDVLVQLVRNSIAHGVESPDEREAGGKPRVATLAIHPARGSSPDSFAFTFRDDGRGLDAARIRSRAVEVGLLQQVEALSIDDSEVAGFIFEPGFTTVEGLAREAGRGMGMNVVKQRVVDDCGGEIEVDSEPGMFCEFSFVIPARAQHALAS